VAVNLDDGGVDHGVFHVRVIRDRIENPFEDIALNPVAETRKDRVPFAEHLRQVAPR
jgi:hypothetical protein